MERTYLMYLFLLRSIYRKRWKSFQTAAYALAFACVLLLVGGALILIIPSSSLRRFDLGGLGYVWGMIGYVVLHLTLARVFRKGSSKATIRIARIASLSIGRPLAVLWVTFCVSLFGYGLFALIASALATQH